MGVTNDRRSLILTARRGAGSGSYLLEIDDHLLGLVNRLASRTQPVTASSPAPEEPESDRARAQLRSFLSPREIQSRLRAGFSLEEVAQEAGVEESWVERFAAPVLAEREQVITRGRKLVFARPRAGESAMNLGESVRFRLEARGVRLIDDAFEGGWSAQHLESTRWIVRFRFDQGGQEQMAEWEVDFSEGTLAGLDKASSALAYVAPGDQPGVQPPAEQPGVQTGATGARAAASSPGSKPKAAPGSKAAPVSKAAPGSKAGVSTRASVSTRGAGGVKSTRGANAATGAKGAVTAKDAIGIKRPSRPSSAFAPPAPSSPTPLSPTPSSPTNTSAVESPVPAAPIIAALRRTSPAPDLDATQAVPRLVPDRSGSGPQRQVEGKSTAPAPSSVNLTEPAPTSEPVPTGQAGLSAVVRSPRTPASITGEADIEGGQPSRIRPNRPLVAPGRQRPPVAPGRERSPIAQADPSETPQDETPQDETPQDGTPQDGTRHDETRHDEAQSGTDRPETPEAASSETETGVAAPATNGTRRSIHRVDSRAP